MPITPYESQKSPYSILVIENPDGGKLWQEVIDALDSWEARGIDLISLTQYTILRPSRVAGVIDTGGGAPPPGTVSLQPFYSVALIGQVSEKVVEQEFSTPTN